MISSKGSAAADGEQRFREGIRKNLGVRLILKFFQDIMECIQDEQTLRTVVAIRNQDACESEAGSENHCLRLVMLATGISI